VDDAEYIHPVFQRAVENEHLSNPATRNMRNVPSAGVPIRACRPTFGWVARGENVSSAAARKRGATSRLALRAR
jgi:hypothetical protein